MDFRYFWYVRSVYKL